MEAAQRASGEWIRLTHDRWRDLVGNRVSKTHWQRRVDGSEFVAETVQYRYNVRDELLDQTSSVSGLTTNAYDANGSLVRSVSSDGQ